MEGQSRPRPAHQPSLALTNEENEAVFRLLDLRCQAQATSVVQVYGTEQPYHNCWHKMLTGVATFTKDSTRRSFYIQVFDITEGVKVFEQEVYREFEYHKSMDFFHQFEGDDRMIGLNFADDADAANFAKVVSTLLANRRRKREERKRQVMQEQQQKLSAGQQQQTQQNYRTPQLTHKEKKKFMSLGTRREKKKYRKEMIGLPTDFQHVSHVGVGKNSLASFNVDEELQGLLMAVGLDQKKLSDNDTREFVYDYIEKHGGMEEFRKASRKYLKRSEDEYGGSEVGQYPYSGRVLPPPPFSTAPAPSIHSAAPPVPHLAGAPQPTSEDVRTGVPPPLPPRYNQGAWSADDEVPPSSLSKYLIPVPPPPARNVQQPLSRGGVPSPPLTTAKGGIPPPGSKGGVPPPQAAIGRVGFSYPTPPPVSIDLGSLPSPSILSFAVPPPPSMSKGAPRSPTPPPPSGVVPPPPPLPTGVVPPPPPLPTGVVPPPPPLPTGVVPPPPPLPTGVVPPPPPLPTGVVPPAPPVPPGGALRPPPVGGVGAPADPRSALLDQIRSGGVRPLKKVAASSPGREAAPADSRSQLLQDIRSGIKLHKVEASEAEGKVEAAPRLEGLALGLHHALQERAKYIQSNDDSNDSLDDEDEDEWDEE